MIYELLYIVPSKFSDTEIDGVVSNVSAILEKAGAKIEKTDNLGKIKLAYPVKKVRFGTYILQYLTFEDNSVLQKLETDLKHTEEVLRHVFIKHVDGMPMQTVTLTSYQEPITPEGKRASAQKEKPAPKQQEIAKEEKISVAELDKKLDEILDSDITQNV